MTGNDVAMVEAKAFIALLKVTYVGNSANAILLVQNELSRFEQRGLTVQQFKEVIERKIVLANALMIPNERMSDKKKMAYFVNGLRPALKSRVLRALRAQAADQAVLQTRSDKPQHFAKGTAPQSNNSGKGKPSKQSTHSSSSKKKFYIYHKSDKHSTAECRVLQNQAHALANGNSEEDMALLQLNLEIKIMNHIYLWTRVLNFLLSIPN